MKQLIGRLHSIETLGTRDGPGLRCVFFLAGCNYRCQFCQNPDTWTCRGSQQITLEQARERLEPLLPYLKQHGGGVTVSGGEPTQQAEFVQALFALCHELGLTTALDTNGSCPIARRAGLLAVTDTVLLDVKASSQKLHRKLTGKPLAPVLEFGRWAAKIPGRLVIRRVLLPGINDSAAELDALGGYAAGLPDKPFIELIAYHRLGVHKWQELGWRYPLAKLKPP
ncbi:MAG: radical SAM protein, partial [Candidatus Firestonebacteria bacterium]|nr:radical SAM protein [Candidatus Firestonebacteria bacterium]